MVKRKKIKVVKTEEDWKPTTLHFKEFKGIYYAFQEGSGPHGVGCWVIKDKNNGPIYYNADLFRIDQAIESFRKRDVSKSKLR